MPEPRSLTEEVAEAKRQDEAVARALAGRKAATGLMVAEDRPSSPPTSPLRVFVSPHQPNARILIRAGTVVKVPSPNGPWEHSRDGDVFVTFRQGVVSLDPTNPSDQLCIDWCETKGRAKDICRDINDPQTALWAKLKEDMSPTSRREASLPSNLNVEEVLAGDLQSLGQSDLIARARSAQQ
jgi:hypothetical protein